MGLWLEAVCKLSISSKDNEATASKGSCTQQIIDLYVRVPSFSRLHPLRHGMSCSFLDALIMPVR